MADDVLLNKAAAIERAVRRVRDEHGGDDANLLIHQTRQDAIILNLQRACESSIDAGDAPGSDPPAGRATGEPRGVRNAAAALAARRSK